MSFAQRSQAQIANQCYENHGHDDDDNDDDDRLGPTAAIMSIGRGHGSVGAGLADLYAVNGRQQHGIQHLRAPNSDNTRVTVA